MSDEFELKDEVCRGLETEQERLDRQGIYGEIKRELVKLGIPAQEIAFIHDFDTPAKKALAFAKANAGQIRVMLASTEKLAYGANLQERLYAIHHGDAAWRPSDIEQREGRLLRPGNKFPEVCIFNYVTEGSFDGFIWQTLENKARFISQIMSGEVTARATEDVDDMVITAAQVKAIASGNPRILERVSIEVELTRLSRLYTVWRNGRRNLKWELESLPERIREADQRIAEHKQAKAARDQNSSDGVFTIKLKRALGGDEWLSFDQRAQAREHLDRLRREVGTAPSTEHCQIGSYRGFQILAQRRPSLSDALFTLVEGFLCLPGGKLLYPFKFGDSEQGLIQSIDAQFRAIDSHLDRALKNRDELKHRHEVIERELASGWSYASKYEELQARLRRVNQLLKEGGSQIDDKQDFAALDEDALRNCEPDVEESVRQSEEVSTRLETPPVPTTSAEPVGDQTALSPAEEKESSLRVAAAIAGEPSRRQITLDDLRNQAPQTNRRKPSSPPRAGQPAQLSLWQ